MSRQPDLDYAQHYLILLNDLLATMEGGCSRPGALAQTAFLCGEAKGVLRDLMWQDHLDDLKSFAKALFSDEEHASWAKGDLTGVEYLRVQLLKTLNALTTRLTVLRCRREDETLAELASAAC